MSSKRWTNSKSHQRRLYEAPKFERFYPFLYEYNSRMIEEETARLTQEIRTIRNFAMSSSLRDEGFPLHPIKKLEKGQQEKESRTQTQGLLGPTKGDALPSLAPSNFEDLELPEEVRRKMGNNFVLPQLGSLNRMMNRPLPTQPASLLNLNVYETQRKRNSPKDSIDPIDMPYTSTTRGQTWKSSRPSSYTDSVLTRGEAIFTAPPLIQREYFETEFLKGEAELSRRAKMELVDLLRDVNALRLGSAATEVPNRMQPESPKDDRANKSRPISSRNVKSGVQTRPSTPKELEDRYGSYFAAPPYLSMEKEVIRRKEEEELCSKLEQELSRKVSELLSKSIQSLKESMEEEAEQNEEPEKPENQDISLKSGQTIANLINIFLKPILTSSTTSTMDLVTRPSIPRLNVYLSLPRRGEFSMLKDLDRAYSGGEVARVILQLKEKLEGQDKSFDFSLHELELLQELAEMEGGAFWIANPTLRKGSSSGRSRGSSQTNATSLKTYFRRSRKSLKGAKTQSEY